MIYEIMQNTLFRINILPSPKKSIPFYPINIFLLNTNNLIYERLVFPIDSYLVFRAELCANLLFICIERKTILNFF